MPRLTRLVTLGMTIALATALATPALGQQLARRAGDTRDPEADALRQRTLTRLLLSQTRNLSAASHGGGEITLHSGKVKAEGADYSALSDLSTDDVLQLTTSSAVKLTTSTTLHFSEGELAAEVLSPGYPGVYSVWLKRRADGWQLLFNAEPDIWGTQRDPAQDVLTVDVEHTKLDESVAELEPKVSVTDDVGTLELHWGSHRWHTNFRLD